MKKVLIFISMIYCLHAEYVFVGCEGNFYQSNGSIWVINNDGVYEYSDNQLGEIVQSLLIHEDKLLVTVNGSHSIYVFDIVSQ